MAQFVDFKSHLQQLLDDISIGLFNVTDIRDMVGDTDKVNVIISALQGSVYENSASIPYKIDIYTDDPKSVESIFTTLAKVNNNKTFISVIEEEGEPKEYTVYQFYGTPAVAEPQQDLGTNVVAHLIMFATLNVFFDVGNVSSVVIDDNEIEFATGTIAYSIESFSNRVSGQELNKGRKKASTTSLQLTMVNKTSFFTNKVLQIMFGQLSGQTIFNCKVKLTNGLEFTIPMILGTNSFSFARNTPNLPSFNVTLIMGDNRSYNNA